jgi:hypothetical protein
MWSTMRRVSFFKVDSNEVTEGVPDVRSYGMNDRAARVGPVIKTETNAKPGAWPGRNVR